ncbi:MAG: PEP-CTERM sorting domain-containing protein [Verrucomicrobia bacterium]|nr:PEP-CTERM sorting domain-containing protein [Verrucomicrobiota bacterium]
MNSWIVAAILFCGTTLPPISARGGVVVDGSVSGGEGWTLLTEDPDARPVLGGDSSTSDFIGESAAYTYGDSSSDTVFTDNRADIITVLWAADDDFFYLAVRGPTVPFNNFSDAGGNNDQGDLYVAIDTSGGSAGGSRTAATGHDSYGAKAVDFLGWTPTHVVGIQYVDNGGGGGAVPEPSTFMLLGVGLAMIRFLRRSRRR